MPALSDDHTVQTDAPRKFDPFEIAREFVTDHDPRRRRNAGSALAAIGTSAAVQRLAEMIVDEAHQDTRQHLQEQLSMAMRKLAQNGGEGAAWEVLTHYATSDKTKDTEKKDHATAALIDLRQRQVWRPLPRAIHAIIDAAIPTVKADGRPLRPSDVQRDAEKALESLDGPDLELAVDNLCTRLDARNQPAGICLLLGRLRRTNAALPARVGARFGGLRRLMDAWMLGHWIPALGPVVRAGAIAPALGLALAGVVVMALDLAYVGPAVAWKSLLPLLILVSAAWSIVLALATTSRMTALRLHYDTSSAIIVSVGRAMLQGGGIAAAVALLLMLFFGLTGSAGGTLVVMTVLMVGAIRGATLLTLWTAAAHEGGIWHGPLLQTLSGTGAGVLTLLAVREAVVNNLGYFGPSTDIPEAADGVWIFLAPSAAAVASAFAHVDWQSASDNPRPLAGTMASRVAAVLTWMLSIAGAMVVAPAAFHMLRPEIPNADFPTAAPGDSRPVYRALVDPRGGEQLFRVTFPQQISVRINNVRDNDNLSLHYLEPRGSRVAADPGPECEANAPGRVASTSFGDSLPLQWGCYRVVMTRSDGADSPIRLLIMGAVRTRLNLARQGEGFLVSLNSNKSTEKLLDARRTGLTLPRPSPVSYLTRTGMLNFKVSGNAPLNVTVATGLPDDVGYVIDRIDGQGAQSVFASGRATSERSTTTGIPRFRDQNRVRDLAQVVLELESSHDSTYHLRFVRGPNDAPFQAAVAVAPSNRVSTIAPVGMTVSATPLNVKQAELRPSPSAMVYAFRDTPFVLRFRIRESVLLSATVPQIDHDLDLTLRELIDGKSKNMQRVDDPEQIDAKLEPGLYELRVNQLGYGGRPSVLTESGGMILRLTAAQRR